MKKPTKSESLLPTRTINKMRTLHLYYMRDVVNKHMQKTRKGVFTADMSFRLWTENQVLWTYDLIWNAFSPHPLSLLDHPLPTSPQFFAHSWCAPSLVRFFARLFDMISAWKRERNGCYAGYFTENLLHHTSLCSWHKHLSVYLLGNALFTLHKISIDH